MTEREGDEENAAAGSAGGLRLRAIAFACGAALMGLEMAGVRLLEPHFGSTIYVWGSIIGIFLGSLSLGYWLGGIIADRRPRLEVLGGVILASSLLIFLIPPLASPLGQWLASSEGMDPRSRALLGSFLLYALPSICLGMVSPFAVRLAARSVSGMGAVAGSLYAWSTLGSLFGTFLVSFILVELIGSRTTVWALGALLVIMAGLCFFSRPRLAAGVLGAAGLVLVLPGWLGLGYAEEAARSDALLYEPLAGGRARHGGEPDRFLVGRESAYHQVALIESGYDTSTRRQRSADERIIYMLFNNQIESGAILRRDDDNAPVETACGYTRMLHLGLLFTGEKPKRVLVIGCGGGIGPQAFAADYADAIERIDVVDIDPVIFELAHEHFRLPSDGKVIRCHVEDGRIFVARSRERWDYVILDAYTAGGRIPRHLITREFFASLQEHLAPGGIVLANVISAIEGEHSRLFRATYKTLRNVFGGSGQIYAFPRHRSDRGENIILVAVPGRPRLGWAEIQKRFRSLRAAWLRQKDLEQIVENVKLVPPEGIEDVPLLTDDFCPTDSMVYY